jgi:hypothetical protein
VADRFFYERGDKDLAFTREQLSEIRKASMARLLCDNANHVKSMQPKAFWRISHNNKVVPCESLPEIDLSLWKDHAYDDYQPFYHSYKK